MRRLFCCALLAAALFPSAAGAQQPLSLLDVPFISQSEALCGGAAAAMVLRYWGETTLTAESFAPLVDRSAAGIATTVLTAELRRRGFTALDVAGSELLARRELEQGRPVIALIEDRPGAFHYVVLTGWHARGVVLHDPARAPFQVMSVGEFDRRWERSDRWMMVVTPGSTPSSPSPPSFPSSPSSPSTPASSCDVAIAAGVAAAQANRLDAAEALLTPAIACPGGAALRELAGVRLVQRRWGEVETLAAAAVEQDASDTYAWKLLGTARFVGNNPTGALDAWNRAGEPRLDLIRIEGLRRTRQRPIERLAGVVTGRVLDADTLRRAQRLVAELPVASSSAVTFVPAGNGLAQLRVVVAERPLVPRGAIDLGILAATALATRELTAGVNSLAGGGERLTVGWRFWPNRPRYSVAVRAPAPWGGLWGMSGSIEEQPFTDPAVTRSRRATADLSLSAWATGVMRWEAGGGLDRWESLGAFGTLRGAYRLATPADRLDLRAEGRGWLGESRFAAWQASATVRSSAGGEGAVLLARAAAAGVTASAPLDLWAAGDTGTARPTLLRAHPALDQGRLRSERLGRALTTVSLEAQYWWRLGLVRVAPAMFIDAGRTSRRLAAGAITDFDLGAGIRTRVPGMPGTLRADVARGFRDGARAFALVYDPSGV